MARRQRKIQRRRALESETGRRRYVTSSAHAAPDDIQEVWNAALLLLRPVLASGKVDLFPEPSADGLDPLPEVARDGWRAIKARVESVSGIGVWVDLVDDALFEAFRAFGLNSIHCLGYAVPLSGHEERTRVIGGPSAGVIVRRDPDHPLVYNHDQGWDVYFEMTDGEWAQLRSRLGELGLNSDALVGPVPAEDAADE